MQAEPSRRPRQQVGIDPDDSCRLDGKRRILARTRVAAGLPALGVVILVGLKMKSAAAEALSVVTGNLDGGGTVGLPAQHDKPIGNHRTGEVHDENDPAQVSLPVWPHDGTVGRCEQ